MVTGRKSGWGKEILAYVPVPEEDDREPQRRGVRANISSEGSSAMPPISFTAWSLLARLVLEEGLREC